MGSRAGNSLSTHSMTTSRPDMQWIPSSQMVESISSLRSLFIKQYKVEPYHQQQNKAEQWYGVVKRYINSLMKHTGAVGHCLLLCLVCVCALVNVTASPSLNGITPIQSLT